MIDPNNVPPVADNELLARFIVKSNEFRADGTVTHRLFLPYGFELSVTRHREATPNEIWEAGVAVAHHRKKTLYGRVDIRAGSCRIGPLDVVERPIPLDNPEHLPENPNHADITGYPRNKEDQVSLAKELAAQVEGKKIDPPQPEGNA